MSLFGPSGKTKELLRKESKGEKEEKEKEDHPICEDCLAFRTKFCDWTMHRSMRRRMASKGRSLRRPIGHAYASIL